MPWRCPACDLPIRHNDIEERPRVGVVYRCHICRLELTADPLTERLTVAPFDARDAGKDEPKRRFPIASD